MKNKDINLGAESAVQDVRTELKSKNIYIGDELDAILKRIEWEAHNGHYEVRKDLL